MEARRSRQTVPLGPLCLVRPDVKVLVDDELHGPAIVTMAFRSPRPTGGRA